MLPRRKIRHKASCGRDESRLIASVMLIVNSSKKEATRVLTAKLTKHTAISLRNMQVSQCDWFLLVMLTSHF